MLSQGLGVTLAGGSQLPGKVVISVKSRLVKFRVVVNKDFRDILDGLQI